jgi:hypothetical protein
VSREGKPPPVQGESEAPARLGVGWRVAMILWAVAFGGLVLSELWDLLLRGVWRLF